MEGGQRWRQQRLVAHHHFVLPGEIWWLAQQLGLGDGDGAGCFPDQHGVVELRSPRRGWAQVSALGTRGENTVQRCNAFLWFSSRSQLVQTVGLHLALSKGGTKLLSLGFFASSHRVRSAYLQYDGRARLLLQHPGRAQEFKRRVGVVDELGVVVDQQVLDVVEDEAKLVRPLDGVQAGPVLGGEGGGEAGQRRGVHHLADLRGRQRFDRWLGKLHPDLHSEVLIP